MSFLSSSHLRQKIDRCIGESVWVGGVGRMPCAANGDQLGPSIYILEIEGLGHTNRLIFGADDQQHRTTNFRQDVVGDLDPGCGVVSQRLKDRSPVLWPVLGGV
jgi:hypothetical protein